MMVKRILLVSVFPLLLFCQDKMKGPKKILSNECNQNISLIYEFYKRHLSPIDGDRCPMVPSCSKYSKEVFRRFGLIRGFVFTCDRLTRCGNDLYYYKQLTNDNSEYYLDNPEKIIKIE